MARKKKSEFSRRSNTSIEPIDTEYPVSETILEETIASEEDTDVIPFRYAITAYGADYPVDGLIKRLNGGDIFVPPFQRSYVWNLRLASRFVESLLLGLPVPGIFFSRDSESSKMLVIDGQQRLKSLQFFYGGIFEPTGRAFELSGVVEQFEGLSYKTLDDGDRRQLDDSILHATIVRQDEPDDDQSSIYFIFERLNTGGVPLQPQQIRAALYYGEFQQLLSTLNEFGPWRAVYGTSSRALRDQELILRFFALYYDAATYDRPMKDFLNKFMARHRHLKKYSAALLTNQFKGAIDLVVKSIGERGFRLERSLNAAVFDSVMVGIAKRLEKGKIQNSAGIADAYKNLLSTNRYRETTARATADKESVAERLDLAVKAFADCR